ncbi:hypothetical protein SAMN04488004_13021 [Loktanella salsilacus]|jgi:hypothetical protein|uniref:Uncharacterized protein n=1 Tax=Loktanella salsilacus TaxID=195913 RepID=A0A1I4IX13_9RHOB|nr:hypothetical protein [Loktanella salsilacus]SFL58810.1 hypothetical protein SAMN04488004_13021 [Loktanella salsilacus]
MTQTNKKHQMIYRAKLDAGIAEMMAVKPKEKVAFTQREAIEEAAGAVQHMLAMNYSLAEVVAKMNDAFGLTLPVGTVRSYLREVKAANAAATPKKTTMRRGPKKQIQDAGTEPTANLDATKMDVTASDDELLDVAVPYLQSAPDDKAAEQTASCDDIQSDSASDDNVNDGEGVSDLDEDALDCLMDKLDNNIGDRS